jgi:hypothetical protein
MTVMPVVGWAQSVSTSVQTAGPTGVGATADTPKSGWKTFPEYLQVRKAFDGGKSENEAAAVGFIAPGQDSKTYWLVDAAIRTTPFNWQLNEAGTFETFFFPSAEWHHMSAEPLLEQKQTNKAGGGLNGELWFPRYSALAVRHAVIGKASVTRNFIKDTTEKSATLALETCMEGVETHEDRGWEGGFRPCAELTYHGARRFHYYPYVGFERYAKLAISSSDDVVAPAFDGSMFLVRVQGDAFPFNRQVIPGDIAGVVLNFEYAYRRALSDADELASENLNALKLSATYFFVEGQVAGVGLSMDFGASPSVNFVNQRRIVLAFRVKTKG